MPTHSSRLARFASRMSDRSGSRARQHGRLSRPVIALIALTVLGASATAITYFVMRPQATMAAEAAPAPPPIPLFYPADPFTVTLNKADGERLLHVGLTFKLSEESARQRLDTYLPIVRSQLLMLLAEQSPDIVQTSDGKRRLADDIRKTVNTVFEGRNDKPPVESVLFNAFVVQ